MASPQEGFPPSLGLDIIRAAEQNEGGTSCHEGQGEGDEGGEGDRAKGTHLAGASTGDGVSQLTRNFTETDPGP